MIAAVVLVGAIGRVGSVPVSREARQPAALLRGALLAPSSSLHWSRFLLVY
ncbi:hypothetical protein ABZ128_03405 [Streptomyces sp. NPDC006326]|uniref:hypothetical protein n=1 Tax=Streptomyces sp. NPDC006326 TaxID=3156752 RepID=UPI0033B87808